ncbi:MAG: hemerythrin domain-containing protein [Burkholderiales bacterium]
MTVLEWSAELELQSAVMDDTHREFVALLNEMGDASASEMLASVDAFLAHTERHFAQEEQWMTATDFPPLGCHKTEHDGILDVVREVRNRVAAGELHYGNALAAALAEWFPLHAQGMDAMLALYLREAGFDPAQTEGADAPVADAPACSR